jgi:hypothetical protein
LSSVLDSHVTINCKIEKKPYTVKFLVGLSQTAFIRGIEAIGGIVYLENNRIFAACFDSNPFESIEDYGEVLKLYRGSSRIFSRSFYIGNHNFLNIKEKLDFVGRVLKSLSGPHNYEIVLIAS